jgi:bifunctional non-homologous end joining protein LigD
LFISHSKLKVGGLRIHLAYWRRGEPGGPISMPLTWEQLAKAHPLDFRMTNVIDILTRSGDQWRNALKNKQDLERALKKNMGA